MSGDLRCEIMTEELEKRECMRCTRLFQPTRADQQYGSTCLRVMAGQKMLPDGFVMPPRKKRKMKAASGGIQGRDEKGRFTAVIV
jgi:hypothetical protein